MANLCITCGQLMGNDAYDSELWSVYSRMSDGRSHREGLSFTIDDFFGSGEDDPDILMLTMDRDMHSRGLCTGCGRPNLQGVTEDEILSDEDAQALAELAAEEAAERRAGC